MKKPAHKHKKADKKAKFFPQGPAAAKVELVSPGLKQAPEKLAPVPQRNEAVEALRISEALFRALITASSDLMYRMSPDWGVMLFLSGGGFLADNHHPNRSWLPQYIAPEDQPQVTAAIHQAVESKSIFQLEHRIQREDGRLGWVSSRAVPLLDAKGEIVEWFGAATNITKRKQAEEALRASEALFRALVTASSDLLYRTSPDWREVRFLSGGGLLADNQNPSRNWLEQYVHPDDQPQVSALIQNGLESKNMVELAHRVRRADGSMGWISSRALPLLDAKGEIVEWFGAAIDITKGKQTEETLQASEARFRELVTGISEVLHRLSPTGDPHLPNSFTR